MPSTTNEKSLILDIFDSSLNYLGVIDACDDFYFKRSFFELGDFTIKLNVNANPTYAALLAKDNIIMVSKNVYKSGVITSITDEIDEDGKGSQYRTAKGFELKAIFQRRIIADLNYDTADNGYVWTMTGPAETCIKSLISYQCGPTCPTASRKYSILTIATDQGRGPTYTINERNSSLYGVVYNCASASLVGWYCYLDLTNKKIVLDCTMGLDRTAAQSTNPWAVFSPDRDTLQKASVVDSVDADYANLIYVNGSTISHTSFSGTEPTGLSRHEKWIDATQVAATGTQTEDAQLANIGNTNLQKYTQTLSLDGSVLPYSQLVYQTNYDVGDKVDVNDGSATYSVQILAVQEEWSSGNYQLTMEWGKPSPTITRQVFESVNRAKGSAVTAINGVNLANSKTQTFYGITDTPPATGNEGDQYHNTVNGKIFEMVSGVWTQMVTVYASGGTLGAAVIGTTYIQSPNYVAGASGWKLDNTAGAINAFAGNIGGFALASGSISATNLALVSGAANVANISVGTGATTAGLGSPSLSADIAIWAGSAFANRATAPFRVTAGGALAATSGAIAGWALGATALTGGSGATGVGLDTGGTNPAFWAGSATPASAPFRVTMAGALTAISGTIGAIGLSASSIFIHGSGGTDSYSDPNTPFFAGSYGGNVGYFSLKNLLTFDPTANAGAGQLTVAGIINAGGGAIGGWTIATTMLKSSAAGTYVALDQSNARVAIVDSGGNTKTAMGYLGGLANPSGGALPTTAYGFWAAAGDAIRIIGSSTTAGSVNMINYDGAYSIYNNAATTEKVRFGSVTGNYGLYSFGSYPLFFGTAGTPKIFIDTSNNLNLNAATLYGSSSASGTLTLSSTSNATKGKILFGTSAYDEVNNRLGINTIPSAELHVKSSNEIVRLETTTARGSGGNYISFYDPIGLKGNVGYISGSNDNFIISNALGSSVLQTTGGTFILDITGNVSVSNGNLTLTSGNLILSSSSASTITSTVTTGNGFYVSSSSLTTGNLFNIGNSSTALSSAPILSYIHSSATNTNSGVTLYGSRVDLSNTGTTSTNIAFYANATGATTNWAFYSAGASSLLPYIYGSTSANGNLVLYSTINATKGYISIPETTASTSYSTGALVVGGGVGIGGALNVGGGASVTGNLSITGTVDGIDISATLNQALLTTSSPTFAGLTLNNVITANNGIKNLVGVVWNTTTPQSVVYAALTAHLAANIAINAFGMHNSGQFIYGVKWDGSTTVSIYAFDYLTAAQSTLSITNVSTTMTDIGTISF